MKTKRIIGLSLVLALVLSLVPVQHITLHAADPLATASDWAIDEIKLAKEMGIGQGLFDMNYKGYATRAEFTDYALGIYQSLKKHGDMANAEDKKLNFTDIDKLDFIVEAYNYGIISGVSDTKFDPNGNLTREQLCKILHNIVKKDQLYNSMGHGNIEFKQNYNDINQISSWALDSVKFMNSNGIIKGSQNSLNPKGTVTREEAILMGYRLYMELLGTRIDTSSNVAEPITNNPLYKNMAIAKVYSNNLYDTNFAYTVWKTINLYVNLMGEYYYSFDDGEYTLSNDEVQEIANAIFYNSKEGLKNMDFSSIPEYEDLNAYHQKVNGQVYYYFKEESNTKSPVKFVKNIRDVDYTTVGFVFDYFDTVSNTNRRYEVYFKEITGHISSDWFYYEISDFKIK